jgi:hypothetical protein
VIDPDPACLDAIERAFASGRSAAGEELLAAALDAGLPWEAVTRAVADGVTARYATARPVESPGAPGAKPGRPARDQRGDLGPVRRIALATHALFR